MKGAALATIVGQIVTAVLAIVYLTHPISFKLDKKSLVLDSKLMRKFMPLGISSFLTQVSIVAIMAAMNNMLVIYGAKSKYGADIPLTVVGIVMKVFQIVIAFAYCVRRKIERRKTCCLDLDESTLVRGSIWNVYFCQ